MCYYFYDIIKFEDIDFDNTFNRKKSHKKKLIDDISYKSLIGAKPLLIRFDEIDLLEFMMELDISIIWSRKICYLH